jgi:hypothetical protein
MKSVSAPLPTGDLRFAFLAIVALALAAGVIATRTFASTAPLRPVPKDIDIVPANPAAPAAPGFTAPPAGINAPGEVAPSLPREGATPLTSAAPTAVPQSAPNGATSRPDSKSTGPGVIGSDPLRADDDPRPGPSLPGKGALK